MKLDALVGGDMAEIVARVRELEAMGFDGVFTFEGNRDVFHPLVLAAEHSDLFCYTNVAIALPRSPMHVAYQAYDLQRWSGGRFALGLGSQIRTHIERRYSARWDRPRTQMREFVEATRAIFETWSTGARLSFAGDYYAFDLMPPIFDPGPLPSGPPPIWLGALGPRMTEMVGEVADGLLVHPFHTSASLDAHTLRSLERGLERRESGRGDVSVGVDVIVGPHDGDEAESVIEACRYNVAFYASTPAYRVILDVHGWGDLQPELRALTREGRWDEMAELVDDELLHAVAVIGSPAEVARELRERYEGTADRLGLSVSGSVTDGALSEVIERVSIDYG